MPVEIELLTAPGWGKCEAAKALALDVIESVRATRPDVALKIVDVSVAPEVAVNYAVTATPAIAINGRLAFRGVPAADALRKQILNATAWFGAGRKYIRPRPALAAPLLVPPWVVGSSIMGERLAAGNSGLELLSNTIAMGAVLVALILTFGPISRAHFNPAVTLADASQRGLPWREVARHGVAQVLRRLCRGRDRSRDNCRGPRRWVCAWRSHLRSVQADLVQHERQGGADGTRNGAKCYAGVVLTPQVRVISAPEGWPSGRRRRPWKRICCSRLF